MPAPTISHCEAALTEAYLNAGFTKKTYDTNGRIVDTRELPDVLKTQIRAQSVALNTIFRNWMAAQTVTIPTTANVGLPSYGTPPNGGLVP